MLKDLRDVILKCEGLIGFRLEPLVELLTELGEFIGQHSEYEKLFETMTHVTAARSGDLAAARMTLKRGAQHMDADQPTAAIQCVGRSLVQLFKHESRHELVRALYVCAGAYERLGLLWAARGTLLSAASIATGDFWTYNDVTPLQAACYNRLKWIELQLGRVPHVLAWHEIDSAVRHVLMQKGYDQKQLAKGEIDFDAIIGILLLRTDFWDLKWLTRTPDILDRLGLFNSAIALRFALGDETGLPEEIIGKGTTTDGVYDFFRQWRDQPAGNDLPRQPVFCDGQREEFSSNILGCEIEIACDNDSTCIALAESLLASMESLLSTGLVRQLISREPELKIDIQKSNHTDKLFEFEVERIEGRPHLSIRCSKFGPHSMPAAAQAELKEIQVELLAATLPQVFFLGESEEKLEALFRDERALDRSINFTSSFVTLNNVLGDEPSTTMSKWTHASTREYPLTRTSAWDCADKERSEGVGGGRPTARMSEAEVPPQMRDDGGVKHSEIQNVSLIRDSLWHQADWIGVAYLWSKDDTHPPTIAPVFTHRHEAEQIFNQWRAQLGVRDVNERIRMSIVRGIDRKNPFAYRIAFGTNIEGAQFTSTSKLLVSSVQIHTMTPATNANLEAFLDRYAKTGCYVVAPCMAMTDASNEVPAF